MAYGFMQRGLVAAVLVGIVCAVMGAFVVLRASRSSATRSATPRSRAWSSRTWSDCRCYLGGAIAAAATALAIGVVARRGSLRFDTAVGVLFAGMFAFGIPVVQLDRGLCRRPVRLPARQCPWMMFADIVQIAVLGGAVLVIVVESCARSSCTRR